MLSLPSFSLQCQLFSSWFAGLRGLCCHGQASLDSYCAIFKSSSAGHSSRIPGPWPTEQKDWWIIFFKFLQISWPQSWIKCKMHRLWDLWHITIIAIYYALCLKWNIFKYFCSTGLRWIKIKKKKKKQKLLKSSFFIFHKWFEWKEDGCEVRQFWIEVTVSPLTNFVLLEDWSSLTDPTDP